MNPRRLIPNIAFIPSVDGRESSVEMPPPSSRHPAPDTRHSGNRRFGMTMIELCVVMGIVTLLMAMVIGLSRHVNTIVKIRRAQADLGAWHEMLNSWYLQFGEYPYEAVDVETGLALNTDLIKDSTPSLNLSNVLERCYLRFGEPDGSTTNITFRSFSTSKVSPIDPWGRPYIYDCDPGRKAYTLFSCGPDARSVLNGTMIPIGAPVTPDPTLDDIYFER